MLVPLYPEFTMFIALYFTSLSIKLIDDWQDQDIDLLCGKFNAITHWGSRCMVYACVCLALGAAFNPVWSLSFFFACYALGMFSQLQVKYLSGLTGWQEIACVVVLCSFLLGIEQMAFAFFMSGLIQLYDDMVDRSEDGVSAKATWVAKLGQNESAILLIVLLALLFYWDWKNTLIVLTALIGYDFTWQIIRISIKGEKGL